MNEEIIKWLLAAAVRFKKMGDKYSQKRSLGENIYGENVSVYLYSPKDQIEIFIGVKCERIWRFDH